MRMAPAHRREVQQETAEVHGRDAWAAQVADEHGAVLIGETGRKIFASSRSITAPRTTKFKQ